MLQKMHELDESSVKCFLSVAGRNLLTIAVRAAVNAEKVLLPVSQQVEGMQRVWVDEESIVGARKLMELSNDYIKWMQAALPEDEYLEHLTVVQNKLQTKRMARKQSLAMTAVTNPQEYADMKVRVSSMPIVSFAYRLHVGTPPRAKETGTETET